MPKLFLPEVLCLFFGSQFVQRMLVLSTVFLYLWHVFVGCLLIRDRINSGFAEMTHLLGLCTWFSASGSHTNRSSSSDSHRRCPRDSIV